MKLIDVNVLLYSVNADAPQYKKVLAYWKSTLASGETIALPWQVILGFMRMATHPKIFSRPLSVEQAASDIDLWLAHPHVVLLHPMDDHWRSLRPLLVGVGTAGNLTMDAHLAALAVEHGATIVSCDGDFSRYRAVRWINPLAV